MINIYILFEFGGVSFVHIFKWYDSEWLKTVATTPRCQIELARLLLLSQKFFSFPIFRIIVLDRCVRLNKFHRENHRYFRASKKVYFRNLSRYWAFQNSIYRNKTHIKLRKDFKKCVNIAGSNFLPLHGTNTKIEKYYHA